LNSDPRRANHADGLAKTRDGTRIRCLLHGDDGDDTRRAVLIHSLAMDHTFWLPVIEHLDAAVLVCDCRGHGESDKPAGPYTVELFAKDIVDVLDHVGWDSALVRRVDGRLRVVASRRPSGVHARSADRHHCLVRRQAPLAEPRRGGRAGGMAALVGFQTTRWFGDKFRADPGHRQGASTSSCAMTSLPKSRPARCSGLPARGASLKCRPR
jgi:3-oxoadipate enol-lactonase